MFTLLVFLQNFAGAFNDAARKTSEAGDFDAVALVGTPRLDVAQENDFAGRLFHRDMNIFHARKEVGKFCEFVIVRGEKGARARVPLKMLDDGPRDGETIEGGGAAADFIEEYEAGGCGVIEDGGDLAHLDKKSGAAAGKIVAGADAGEDAVGDGQFGLARGNEGAHLCHEDNQRSLAKIRGFSAHIRTGDEQKLLPARLEAKIVRDKAFAFLAEEFFNDGMAATDDEEFAGGVEFRAGITAIGGELCESREHVELGNG